jgi:hypothetical protein
MRLAGAFDGERNDPPARRRHQPHVSSVALRFVSEC